MIPNFPELPFFTTDYRPANYKINPIKNKQVDSVTRSLPNTYRKHSNKRKINCRPYSRHTGWNTTKSKNGPGRKPGAVLQRIESQLTP